MLNRLKWLAIAVVAIVVVAVFSIDRIAAFYWKADNATVRLSGCKSTDCELHGTLRISPVTGEFYISTNDGQEIWFNKKAMDMATFPAPAKN